MNGWKTTQVDGTSITLNPAVVHFIQPAGQSQIGGAGPAVDISNVYLKDVGVLQVAGTDEDLTAEWEAALAGS